MRTWRYFSIEIVLVAVLGGAVAYFGYLLYGLMVPDSSLERYDGQQAYLHVGTQLGFGERVSGTEASADTLEWLTDELVKLDWDIIVQDYTVDDSLAAKNVIAQKGKGPQTGPVIILSTHYDTRAASDLDEDEEQRSEPTPGANAGASGTGLLLELARVLEVDEDKQTVCLVFFDGEDNGGLPGWEYAMGSEAFLSRIASDTPRCSSPTAAVYLDLVGAKEANIASVGPEARPLVDTLRDIAEEVGYGQTFRGPQVRDEVDTLTHFTEAGIPTVMLADMKYDYRHTTHDTLDKVGAGTLQKVGDVLKAWIETGEFS
jgi:glutaminyl-peptide cyclotransferase